MRSNGAENFWAWSLTRYELPGVESALLDLQDRFGCNVNMLLWLCWCAERFSPVTKTEIKKAIELTADWHKEVTQPLRDARRYLKTASYGDAFHILEGLRAEIKGSELQAEKVEQRRLETFAGEMLEPDEVEDRSTLLARAKSNLEAYLRQTPAARAPEEVASLIDPLIGFIFDASPRPSTVKAGAHE